MGLLGVIRNTFKKDEEKQRIKSLIKQADISSDTTNTILFWVPGGMPLMLHIEGAIALALKLRGYNVHAVICDGALQACVKREASDGIPINVWKHACKECRTQNSLVLDKLNIGFSYIGDFVPQHVRSRLLDEAKSLTWESLDSLTCDSINIGKNVRSSIMRYLKGGNLAGHELVVQEYGYSGLVAATAALSAIECIKPSQIFMSHGTYIDWGPALQEALAGNIPVIAWMASYLRARFYFCHVEDIARIDFHNLGENVWREQRSLSMTQFQDARLDKFLNDRYQKQISFDMKHFKEYKGEVDLLRRQYGLLDTKPIWGIMSHINWDAVADYAPMAYETFDEWILDTLNEVVEIPGVQWLIKIHPAEAWDSPENGVQQLIQKHFPTLPPHVRVINAEDEISPLDFFELIDGGITVYGTPGLELALQGKPVVLAGEAHYGGKGFTYDGLSPESYRRLLREAASLKPLSKEQQRLARNYAYCYFIQRQIPLAIVDDPESAWWQFQFSKSNLLLPKEDPFIDFICSRIIDGKDFVMDEELVKLSELRDEAAIILAENAGLDIQALETVEENNAV
ncbi:MAG TPA: hypothetical protein VGK02_08225 [Candidatus Aquicultor sp.]|jgi:hypothetical protein